MFIKVSDANPEQGILERHVNTDNVEMVTFEINKPGTASIDFRSQRRFLVTESAGRLLLTLTESNTSLLEEGEDEENAPEFAGAAAISPDPSEKFIPQSYIRTGRLTTPHREPKMPAVPLTTRIAQYLRDEAPHGVALSGFRETPRFIQESASLLPALQSLTEERVVIAIGDYNVSGVSPIYYHASNAPKPEPIDNGEDAKALFTEAQTGF